MKKEKIKKLDKLISKICKEKFTSEWKKLNYKLIPITMIAAKEGNEKDFNELYQYLYENKYNQICRTPSGGISIKSSERFNFDKYDIRQLNGCIELTVCTLEKSARIQFRLPNYKSEDDEEELMSAGQYLKKYWLPTCKKYGINMDDYKCSKEIGLEYKNEIHAPDIKIYDIAASYNIPYEHAYHLDFHKFYISGLLNTHPEFKPVVEDLVKKAVGKDKKMHKAGLAAMIGYFQSKYCNYKYAKLSKDAINDAYKRFDEVKADIKKAGIRILATNTDGIWIVGEYHGKYEGPDLTQWSLDHEDCTIRFKSAGAYEFIENNKYYPVIRGRTRLDKILPRNDWQWGDIFKKTAEKISWTFVEGTGIQWIGE